MKRKMIIAGIVLTLALSGCGTGSTANEGAISTAVGDEVSEKMVNDINALGEITLDDEDQINKLIERYATLTDSQKEAVNNYATLLDAQDRIEELKVEEKAKAEEYLVIERKYYDYIDKAISALKSQAKYPSSLEIETIYIVQETADMVFVSIDYTADNDLGNQKHGTVSTSFGELSGYAISGYVPLLESDTIKTLAEKLISGTHEDYQVKIGEDFYAASEDVDSKDAKFAFKVNLEDFVAQGHSLN